VFYGNSLLAGSVILAIMIVPYIAAVSARCCCRPVASARRRWAWAPRGGKRYGPPVVPYGRAGLIGAVILGLGRALGETMAVTHAHPATARHRSVSAAAAYTMAAAIANEFSEATTNLYLSALFEVGLILFVITVAVTRWPAS